MGSHAGNGIRRCTRRTEPELRDLKSIVLLVSAWLKRVARQTQPHLFHKTMQSKFQPVFTSKPIQIRSTPKAITPFGGLVSMVEFFSKIGLAPKLQETMPFHYSSPNAIPPAHTLMTFLISVIAGASRFAHTDTRRSRRFWESSLRSIC